MFSMVQTLKSLLRCAGSSLAGVTVELGLMTLLVSVLHLFYLVGALLAGALYFSLSFLLNRHWAFRAARAPALPQLLRHGLVFGGGMLLGTPLLWLLVSGFGVPYQLAWLAVGGVSFLCWTFPMQRWFTYRGALP